jgi:phenylacetate-coenzyme A ligase PaaK-like adenylate-forming protein
MTEVKELRKLIFDINSEKEFNALAIAICQFQYGRNTIYQQYCDLLKVDVATITDYHQIPFLPIEFFKTQQVLCGNYFEKVFKSSGTTGQQKSQHLVADLSIYEESFLRCFEQFYGADTNLAIIALLPNYLEQGDSSLVYMVTKLVELSDNKLSGFYTKDEVATVIKEQESNNQKALLIGVSYALLDLVEQQQFNLKNTTVMETGGMKGRRKELTREELHSELTTGFGVDTIHSEYGMTELLSQGYSKGNGIYEAPNWMQFLIRDPQDPLTIIEQGRTGGVNVIDLANINSCSFIATQDLGKLNPNGTFQILGRFDNSDIRGCNLMMV